MNTKVIGILASTVLLCGCATYNSVEAGKFDPDDFGEANRMTYAAMIIDPDPQYDGPMEGSGEHAADAIEAYREGSVEEPERVSTSSGGGGGGSSGGGGR